MIVFYLQERFPKHSPRVPAGEGSTRNATLGARQGEGRVDEIAAFLNERLKPGEKVQPLDWTGGAIHAMLLAKAEIATSFLYDYHFYHDISSPLIQGFRKKFLGEMESSKPRFIIEIVTDKPWVTGPDTTFEFPQLRSFLKGNYFVARQGDGYLIYESKGKD